MDYSWLWFDVESIEVGFISIGRNSFVIRICHLLHAQELYNGDVLR